MTLSLKYLRMSSFFKYLRVRLLKMLKLYPVIIVFTIILALGAGLVLGNIFKGRAESEDHTKFQIGLVGNASDSYLGIGVFAVTNLDISKDYAEFVEMTENEAKKKLKNNEILGYVSIPDGFIESVLYGENEDIKFITNKTPAILGTLLVEEICTVVSDFVVGAQNGIYGYSDYIKDLPSAERSKLIDKMNIEYLSCVFDRDAAYEVSELGFSKNLSFVVYYTGAFSVLIILLWGMCCSGLMINNSYSLSRSLIFSGRGVVSQILGDFIPFALIISVNTLLLVSALGVIAECFELNLPDFQIIDSFSSCLSLGFSLIPVVLVLCSMQLFLYEISNGVIGSIVLQVLVTISFSFLSGFFFPIYSRPSLLQKFSEFLPTTAAFNYISSVFTENYSNASLFSILLWTAVLLGAAVFVRRFKVRSERYA